MSIVAAMKLHSEVGTSDRVLNHVLTVYGVSAELSALLFVRENAIDIGTVADGAILHDIGRNFTHDPSHGYKGAEFLREKGWPESVVRIVARHVGAGIGKEEAEEFGIPPDDYIPATLEEKVVCYSDKLVAGTRLVSFSDTLQRYRRTLGERHPAIARLKSLRQEIDDLSGGGFDPAR